MTSGFRGRLPTLWHGRGVARRIMRRLTANRRTLVIADSSIRVLEPPARLVDVVEVDPSSLDVRTLVEIAAHVAIRRPEVVLAVGGGTVLDAAKLAALSLLPERILDFAVERASREALTFLPDVPPPVDIVAVPTTIGTSSETNGVGILTNDQGHRLVIGRALVPRHALLDPENLSTLPAASVREGALEAFLRLAGASTSPRRSARARADAVAIARAILEAGDQQVDSSDTRLRLARLSAATQRTAALRGHDRYAPRHWYVANEVAFVLGARKMAATAAVIAVVWQRVCGGDSRWGDRVSLERFWSDVASSSSLPGHPALGIAELIERWAIAPPPTPAESDLERIAVATMRAWGAGRPMLAGLGPQDFRDVLRASAWSDRSGAADGGPRPVRGGDTHEP
ncbi:daptide-type RiPP biosynthesis dehydogenase [Microbacterium sp. LS_15]|uniref:daptide-type RiPP biosynthesis dehydogenase n=1 Tax=Microbacterium sp. LS_15 TaxID=3055790 RepID=UPI0035C25E88